MPTYEVKCSKCNKVKEVRTSKVYGTGEVIGLHEGCNGELVKQFKSSIQTIQGLSTPGITKK